MLNISEINIKEYFMAAWPLFRKRGPIGAAIIMMAWASANKQPSIQVSINQIVAVWLLGMTKQYSTAELAWTAASRQLQQLASQARER